jgi:hypothetical protein
MATEVLDSTTHGLHGGQKGVPSITMSDTLVLFTVLLSSEVEIDAHGQAERSVIDRRAIDGRRIWEFERGVTEAEGMAVRATIGVLARTEQVEVADKE